MRSESIKHEKEILSRCLKRDRKAQKMLYEFYAPAMLGICIRFAGNRDEAEDILQDGFVKVFTKLGDFEGRSTLYGWMRKIMINTAITYYHRNLKHRYHYDIDDLGDKETGENNWEGSEFTREELQDVIASLPPGYRMVFSLYAVEGYKHKEIARKLDIDINTSKSQYSRARKLIQAKLSTLSGKENKNEG